MTFLDFLIFEFKIAVMRWIYRFRQVGRRSLSEAEIEGLRQSARRFSDLRFVYGGTAVLFFLGAIGGIMFAASGDRWGWIQFVAALVVFFFALSLASGAEETSLLHRRAARVGEVDIFERTAVPAEVRAQYRGHVDGDGEFVDTLYWKEEERFLERLEKMAGQPVTWFETPIDDDVPIVVQGSTVPRAVNVYSISLS